MRLRRVSPNGTGYTRRRVGRGFVYTDAAGRRLDPEQVARIEALVIPPAWKDVWIAPVANGHIQAVGTDDAGRRQYIYHPRWRLQRDQDKFDRILTVSQALPSAREQVAEHIVLPGMPRERALATAFRMLDLGYFRVGGESYAADHGHYGLATLLKSHVRMRRGVLVFEFLAKSGKLQHIELTDPALIDAIAMLRNRRDGNPELLAYRNGREWVDVTSADINAYVKEMIRADVSAKDFRTWHATVLASIALARYDLTSTSERVRRRAVASAVREVSEYLGNTPTVAWKSYIDPRVVDLYEDGVTIAGALATLGDEPDIGDPLVYAVTEDAVRNLLEESPTALGRSRRRRAA